MVLKTNGKTVKEFWADKEFWGEAYYDDALIHINGKDMDGDFIVESLSDDDVVTVEGGYLENHPKFDELEKAFRHWLKGKTHTLLNARIPKGRESEFRKLVAQLGGEVV